MTDVHGGRIREAAAALGRPPAEMLDFSANVNFLGPAPSVVVAARAAVDEMAWYPSDPPVALRRAAAEFLQVPEEAVLLGNGASELIFLVVAFFRPRRVLVLGPTFTEYERAARAWDAEVDVLWAPAASGYRLTSADVDPAELDRRFAAADLFFYCDPNNPTGALLDRGLRTLLLEAAGRTETPVFADESFLAFTAAWPEGSLTREAHPHAIVLHSFTKILSLPGLRLGALVVPERWRPGLSRRVPPWNLNCVVQSAALAGLAEEDLLQATAATTTVARDALVAGLEGLPGLAEVLPADGNFLCLRLEGPLAPELVTRLRDEHGVLVRDLSRFPGMGPSYLRVAVRSPDENRRLLEAMGTVLGSLVSSRPEAAPVSGSPAGRPADSRAEAAVR
jgi:threonine-phosphate decarboxylase